MKCFHHNDMDGKCSAAIVARLYVHLWKIPNCQFIEIDYNHRFPIEIIEQGEEVFIVDFSLQTDDFEKLLSITDKVTWIDHHKTAIEKFKHIDCSTVPGIRESGTAACVLVWRYLLPTLALPLAVDLIGDYDVWDFKYGDDARLFQLGIKAADYPVQSIDWQYLFENNDHCDLIIKDGITIKTYEEARNLNIIENYGFYADFEGHRAVCCNNGKTNSQLFDRVKENSYEIMMPFIYDGKTYTVSIYTKRDDIDCSEIAKKYGGGGHRQAAGFQCAELPFFKIEREGRVNVIH
jgi:oligoribonuclease NrnB/cAMP/cGMP phosphodiesterase (DHH superfamily)